MSNTETSETEILSIQLVYQMVNEHEYEIYCKHGGNSYLVELRGDILYVESVNNTAIEQTLKEISVIEVDDNGRVIDILVKGDYDTQMVDNLIDYIVDEKLKEI